MSIQVLPQNESLFGKLGKGIGQGLSEQLPKEIARHRLSSGLKNLGEQDFSGKNELQLLGDIYNIPGMTPEIANLAQQQLKRQNFLNRKPGSTGQKESIPIETQKSLGEEGFVSPSQIQEYKGKLLQEPSYSDVKSLADQYLNQALTQDPSEAMKLAREELSQNRQSQQNKISSFRNDIGERLKLTLQGQGLGDYADVNGQIQQDLLDQGEYMLGQGKTSEEVANKLNDIALTLGKNYNNLRETGSFWNQFRTSKVKDTELREQRKEFSKYGWGNLFDELASAETGMTPLAIANITDPLKNPKIKEKLKSKSYFKNNDKFLRDIAKDITPRDNLYAIEYLLREKGISVNDFKRVLQELESDGDIVLSKQQQRQQVPPISENFLGDLLHEVF